MSVEDRKGIALGKIPRWESQLWSYVGSGDGEDCPIHDQCQINKRNGWCPGAHRDYVKKLLDMKIFNLSSFNYLPSEYKGRAECKLFKLIEKLSGNYFKRGKA